jgi:hypothetical protein
MTAYLSDKGTADSTKKIEILTINYRQLKKTVDAQKELLAVLMEHLDVDIRKIN